MPAVDVCLGMTASRAFTATSAILLATVLTSCSTGDDATPTAASTAARAPTASTSLPEPSHGGWIAHQESTGTREEVFVVRTDGSDAHSLTSAVPGINLTNPDWSPDGRRLVFAATGMDGLDDLWTVDAEGLGPAMILDCAGDCVWLDDPAWSPDGKSIVYARMARIAGAGVGTLETLDVATGEVSVVLPAAEKDFFAGARWSPDGKSIVLEVAHRADSSVYSDIVGVTLSAVDVSAATPEIRSLTDPSLFAATADWSPNGELIVYSALPTRDAEQPDLFVIHPDGSGATRLTTLAEQGSYAEQPTFSADGAEVVFVGALAAGEDDRLLTVASSGGDIRSATGDVVVNGHHPRIRPAG
jgi:Tol biopolymer transport system component